MTENGDEVGVDEEIDVEEEEDEGVALAEEDVAEEDIDASGEGEEGAAVVMGEAAEAWEGKSAPSFYITVMLVGSAVMFLCGVVFTLFELMGYWD